MFQQQPNFRHNTRPLPTASSVDLFAAPTATAWATKYRAAQRLKDEQINLPAENRGSEQSNHCHQADMLNAYATLSGIGASICEFRRLNLLSSDLNKKLATNLIQWYEPSNIFPQIDGDFATLSERSASLRLLWHYTFMSLTVDLNALEVSVGREGRNNNIISDAQKYVRSWISSLNSKRTLFHALYIQILQQLQSVFVILLR